MIERGKMNKELLLIFIVGPIAVEVGKAIIKDFQDRRALKTTSKQIDDINILVNLVKKNLISHIQEQNTSHKMKATRALIELLEKAFSNPIYYTTERDLNKYMDYVGSKVFNTSNCVEESVEEFSNDLDTLARKAFSPLL